MKVLEENFGVLNAMITRTQKASENELQGILEFTMDAIVSSDILGNRHSSIVDGFSTSVVGKSMIKVMAW